MNRKFIEAYLSAFRSRKPFAAVDCVSTTDIRQEENLIANFFILSHKMTIWWFSRFPNAVDTIDTMRLYRTRNTGNSEQDNAS